MRCLSLPALLALAFPLVGAETLYFEADMPEGTRWISLHFDGDQVGGTQFWQPNGGDRRTGGFFRGSREEGGLLRLVYAAEQVEEVICKLEGDRLLIGEGELVEDGGGALRLKHPGEVVFKQALARVPVESPEPGSPERKAIMDAMRGPIAAYVGGPVVFTGEVLAYGGWARFSGDVATSDGRKPEDENVAVELGFDFLSLLKKDAEGRWQVLYWGFSSDISGAEEMAAKFPQAPWVLLTPWIPID